MAVKEHGQAWMGMDKVLESAANDSTKFYALQVLEHAIKYRWNIIDPTQKAGIKGYVVRKIVEVCTPPPRGRPEP